VRWRSQHKTGKLKLKKIHPSVTQFLRREARTSRTLRPKAFPGIRTMAWPLTNSPEADPPEADRRERFRLAMVLAEEAIHHRGWAMATLATP
jgi:hypothetical protein